VAEGNAHRLSLSDPKWAIGPSQWAGHGGGAVGPTNATLTLLAEQAIEVLDFEVERGRLWNWQHLDDAMRELRGPA
jgi:hypothetical protein